MTIVDAKWLEVHWNGEEMKPFYLLGLAGSSGIAKLMLDQNNCVYYGSKIGNNNIFFCKLLK